MNTSLELLQPPVGTPQDARICVLHHADRISKQDIRTVRPRHSLKLSTLDAPLTAYQANIRCAEAQLARTIAENAASKADASNKAKSDFIADMSHEIRTPLGAIVGLARHLMTTELDSKQKDCLAMLQGCADDLMAMLNHSLQIDKIESGVVRLENAPFSLHALLSNIVGLMSVKSQEKNILLTLHHAIGNYETFIGDSGRVRQILVNLIGNAIKFTTIGSVDVSLILGGKTNGKQKLSIAVADTGMGIAPDKVETIFQRFAQADPSILREFGGTGLGLSITKALAESMGGDIGVTSVVGKGSVFTFNFQLALEPSKDDRLNANHPSGAMASKMPATA